jgi:putative effector of murein hydrolase
LMFMLLVTMHPPLHFVLALISIVLLDWSRQRFISLWSWSVLVSILACLAFLLLFNIGHQHHNLHWSSEAVRRITCSRSTPGQEYW